jgi:AcrR family transcriptional regulator
MKTPKRPYSMTLRSERAQETRERILEAAMAIYSAGPIEGFTLEEIAHRSETTVQTVLRAFESKENLLIAVLFRLGEVGASLKPTPPGGDIRPPSPRLTRAGSTIAIGSRPFSRPWRRARLRRNARKSWMRSRSRPTFTPGRNCEGIGGSAERPPLL